MPTAKLSPEEYLRYIVAAVDEHLADFLPKVFSHESVARFSGTPTWTYDSKAITHMIAVPIWDLLSRPAKRWRPVFAVTMLEALGRSAEPFMTLLCALAELSHTGSLIIDDIEDRSSHRRGSESAHVRYGIPTALNAANVLYFLPQLLLEGHPALTEKQNLAIHTLINRQFVRAHFGQTMDLFWSERARLNGVLEASPEVLRNRVLQMYSCKSAAVTVSAAEIASIIVSADTRVREASVCFGEAVGVAFQIMDDVRDYVSTSTPLKPEGHDLARGKLTLVVVEALAALDAGARQDVVSFLFKSSPAKEEVETVADTIRDAGILDRCRDRALSIFGVAKQDFMEAVPPSVPRDALLLACERLFKVR